MTDYEACDDLTLVRGVLAGRDEAVQAFGQRMRFLPRILNGLNRRFGHPLGDHDLADLLQDTLIVVFRKLDRFVHDTSLEGWVYRISYLEMRNALRRRYKRTVPLEDVASDEAGDESGTPRREDYAALYSGLERIDGRQAEVIRLRFFEGLGFGEIGKRLAEPIGTVKTRYYRGMVKLEELLRARYGGEVVG